MSLKIISFHCTLKNLMGSTLGETYNNEVLVSKMDGCEHLSGLIKELETIQAGEEKKVSLSAKDAYGFYDPALSFKIPLSDLNSHFNFKVGDTIELKHMNKIMPYRIVAIDQGEVLLDGNHPLAGQDLVFEVKATEVKDAQPEDLAESSFISNARLQH